MSGGARSAGIIGCTLLCATLLGVLAAFPLCALASASLATAAADLQSGKADEAASLLTDVLRSEPQNAEANNLLCRVEYTLEEFDEAASHCEKAVSLDSQNARYHLWLGRALGERASRASFMSAFSLAKRTRQEFETAVKLNPKDADALSDLCQFYEEAPGAVGGGVDKAEDIASKLDVVDAALGHQAHGEIAEKKKDLAAAEQDFKSAIQGAAHPAFQWMALASFYRRHERWQEMEAAVNSGSAAAARDRHAAVALFNGASILARTDRQTDLAIKMLTGYLASPDKTEEAPAFEAMIKLAKLYKKSGDLAAAERQRQAALAIAHNYRPAQDPKL